MIMRRMARLAALTGLVTVMTTAAPPARAETAETGLGCDVFCAVTFAVCIAATASPSCVAYYQGCVAGCAL